MRHTLVRYAYKMTNNPLNKKHGRVNPKNIRKPLQGVQPVGLEKPHARWELTTGELEEEEILANGERVPVKEMIPQIVVPNLENCPFKPYMPYKLEELHIPPIQAKRLFDMFYAEQIEADYKGEKLEEVPEKSGNLTEKLSNLFLRKNR